MRAIKYLIPLLVVVGILSWMRTEHTKSSLPKLGKFKRMNLTAMDGEQFTGAEFIGKLSAVNFFFTSCKRVCPMTMANLSKVQQEFAKDDKIVFASISVDPKRDTPERLAKFQSRFEGEKDNWFYLRGDRTEVGRILEEEFKLADSEAPDFHTTKVMLIDQELNIRGYYDSMKPVELAKLQEDMKSLQ